MISSQLGAGFAIVPVPPIQPWETGPGTGVYQRGNSNTVCAHAGNTVYRTPHNVVREAEAGARWPGDLTQMMFLPDGRLVPKKAYANDMFRGADPTPTVIYAGPRTGGLRTLVPAVAMFAGAALGYKTATKHQVLGAAGGAVVGGILGLIFR